MSKTTRFIDIPRIANYHDGKVTNLRKITQIGKELKALQYTIALHSMEDTNNCTLEAYEQVFDNLADASLQLTEEMPRPFYSDEQRKNISLCIKNRVTK